MPASGISDDRRQSSRSHVAPRPPAQPQHRPLHQHVRRSRQHGRKRQCHGQPNDAMATGEVIGQRKGAPVPQIERVAEPPDQQGRPARGRGERRWADRAAPGTAGAGRRPAGRCATPGGRSRRAAGSPRPAAQTPPAIGGPAQSNQAGAVPARPATHPRRWSRCACQYPGTDGCSATPGWPAHGRTARTTAVAMPEQPQPPRQHRQAQRQHPAPATAAPDRGQHQRPHGVEMLLDRQRPQYVERVAHPGQGGAVALPHIVDVGAVEQRRQPAQRDTCRQRRVSTRQQRT